MASFLTPPAYKPERTDANVDADYKRLRWQVFIGIFIGYAGFYLVRKNFSMAIPMLEPFGFTKGMLGTALAMNAVAYGFSKFVMASISDRSNARRFLPLGLILSAIAMLFMMVPITMLDPIGHPERRGLAVFLMGAFNFLVGWFQGMGWPPCGRVMTRWFSIKERGTWMSVWNCAHNVGGALVGPMAAYGAMWFGSWFYGNDEKMYFLIGTYAFPAAVAVLIAIIAYVLIRDTPQSCGLPSIEKWSGSASKNYDEKKSEQSLSIGQIFKTVLSNKFLWYIALANSFIYMVRYGCLDWAPTILSEQGVDIKNAGWAYFAYEIAGHLLAEHDQPERSHRMSHRHRLPHLWSRDAHRCSSSGPGTEECSRHCRRTHRFHGLRAGYRHPGQYRAGICRRAHWQLGHALHPAHRGLCGCHLLHGTDLQGGAIPRGRP